jgi:penicillin-binding protein 2
MDKYLKNKKIKTYFRDYDPPPSLPPIRRAPDIEPQETLLDNLAQKKEEELGISEKKFETPLSRWTLQGFLISALILFFILFFRTLQLQILEGGKYSALAKENKFVIYQIRAERGVVYDRNGVQLVFNRPSFDLTFSAAEKVKSCLNQNLNLSACPELKTLEEVSKILELNFEELKEKIKESEEPSILISENLPHEILILLQTKISANELPGFQIERNSIRYYPEGKDLAHLIGYTGKIRVEELKAEPENYSIFDWVGRDGLEKSYETVLRKNPGKLQIERDALGNEISKKIIQYPESGKSLILWVDLKLQKKIEESLEETLKRVGSQKAVAVALDPKTGGVMAMVSLPSFDNNLFQKGADQEALMKLLEDPLNLDPLFNRVISGGYLIGSTIKPLTASAALEEKIISPSKKLNCQGLISIPNPYFPDLPPKEIHDWRIHGPTDLRKAIAESCNVYFYTIGGGYGDQEGLGPTRIKNYLELFGWGNKTQIDLPAEEAGLIPDPEWKKTQFEKKIDQIWYDGDTYNLSIGQGFIKVTPLQVANAFAAIANGGKLYQPIIAKEIVDSEKNLIEEIKPKIVRENFIDSENLQIVREGMRQAVTGFNSPYASSITLNSLPVPVAAKTGTAQVKEGYYNNWVTVFAPYDDPQIVLTVMIEDVKGDQVAALPVAKEVLEWYFQSF